MHQPLADWFIAFEQGRAAEDDLPEEARDPALINYKRMTSYSTDAQESIKGRVDLLNARFFAALPDIEPIDPKRGFSHAQRLAIFRRDGGQCQLRIKCDGIKVGWDNWHADHKSPHVKGGKTTVGNGQLACVDCNLAKGGAA